MTFGARMLKTGVAVTLSLYISVWLQFSPPVIAAVAAIFAMQPTIYRSWRYFLDQVQTSTLGAVIAIVAGMYFSNDPVAVGIVCIIVIMLCLKLKMSETIGLTLVTVIAVMEASGDWMFALNRFLLSMIGIVSAFLINIAFLPPRPKRQFHKQVHTVFGELAMLLRTSISDEMKEKVFREQRKKLLDNLRQLEDKYKLIEEELKRIKRVPYAQMRQLAVYKQALYALRKGTGVLESVEEHYFPGKRTASLHAAYREHLERLVLFNEHVLLKFDEKLKPGSGHAKQVEAANAAFMEEAHQLAGADGQGTLRLAIVAAAIYEYGHQLLRLNRLVEHSVSRKHGSGTVAFRE